MIPATQFRNLAKKRGVPLVTIEKDYVIGWLLWGIYTNSRLSKNLVLKGGNCLRKLYIPDTRFSDDLDFTAYELPSMNEFSKEMRTICGRLKEVSGIPFEIEMTRVETIQITGKDCRALKARVYFKGFADDSSVTMKIKFDVSEYERIVLPTQLNPIIHDYPDGPYLAADVLSYSVEEVLAEKLRSWIQRTRPQDLYDIAQIIQSDQLTISKKNVITAFFKKSIFKDIPIVGRDELLQEYKFGVVERSWLRTIVCPANALQAFENCSHLFTEFVKVIFDPKLLGELRLVGLTTPLHSTVIPTITREPIIEAGRARKLVRIKYHGKDRNVEPYSFKFKKGTEYFYGYDRTRGNTIKSFFLHEIKSASIMSHEFEPRWVVEF